MLGASAQVPPGAGTPPRIRNDRRLLEFIRATIAQARLEHIFLVIALAWGIAQVFVVPPLQVPDEGDHWFRAWVLTEGQVTADRQGMITLPGIFVRTVDLYVPLADAGLPVSLQGQPGFSSYENLFDGSGPTGTVRVFSRVASYGPVGYLPQAAGIGVGRLLGAPLLTCFYLARLANLLVAVTLLFFAIRLAPFGKQLFVLVALLPMTMFEFASVSCDALTISGAMFFTALVLWASTRARLRRVDIALVLLAAALLLNVKPGYWALVLLVLLISPRQFGSRVRHSAFVAGCVVVVAAVFLVGLVLTGTDARVQGSGGAHEQLLFILREPLSFLGILWSNIQSDGLRWILQSIGVLGWLKIALPSTFYVLVLIAAVGLLFLERNDVGVQFTRRVLLAAVGIAVFISMAVALYAFLEPPGSESVFFQGRYLGPVLLVLFLSADGVRFRRLSLGTPFVVIVLLGMMAQNFDALISAYHS